MPLIPDPGRQPDTGMFLPETADFLFKTFISPILEYGSPIWGVHDLMKGAGREFFKFQVSAARFILGLPVRATSEAVLSELGWRPFWVYGRRSV